MKKWFIGLFIVVAGVVIYVWNTDDYIADNEGFERSLTLPDKKIVKNSSTTSASPKPIQSKEPPKSPSEVSIALDKTIDSQMAAKFDPKARGPSSLAGYFGNSPLSINRRSYLVSHELRSMPEDQFETQMGLEILRENGHVFFESSDNNIGHPALLNTRNKSLALLTGRVLLKNMGQDQAAQIASQYGAELDRSMGHLGIYAFVAGSNVLDIGQELGANAEVELFEGRIHAK